MENGPFRPTDGTARPSAQHWRDIGVLQRARGASIGDMPRLGSRTATSRAEVPQTELSATEVPGRFRTPVHRRPSPLGRALLLGASLVLVVIVGVVLGRLITGRFSHWIYWDIDIPVRSFADHSSDSRPGVVRAARRLSTLGTPFVTGAVAVLVGSVWAARTRRWRPLVLLLFVFTAAGAVTFVVKPLVHRSPQSGPIPAFTPGTFPSGHAILSLAVYGAIAWLIMRTALPLVLRVLLVVPLLVLPPVIGLARVYLLDHYLSDVLGGFVLGVALIVAGAVAIAPWPEHDT